MEKRALIAFILSFLILIVWSVMFQQKTPPPPKQAPAPTVETPQPATQPKPPAVGTAAQPPPTTGVEAQQAPIQPPVGEKDIVVETPLYRALFSTAGAALKSFKLKKYHETKDTASPMVELINPEQKGANSFRMGFVPQTGAELPLVRYRASEEALTLGPGSAPRDLIFTGTTPEGVRVTQTFRIDPALYPMDLTVAAENTTQNQITGNVRALLKTTPPSKKSSYYAFVGMALLLDDKLEKLEPDDMEEKKGFSGQIGWVAYESEYFMQAVVPENAPKGAFSGQSLPSGALEAYYIGPPLSLVSRGVSKARFTLYFGPRDLTVLKETGNHLDRAINFGWTDIIAKPLLYTLRFFNDYVKNWGISIILLTICIKIIFWPLTHKSYKSMKEMQKLQPLMAKIREKHKDNKEQMNKELMALYKTYKVNPFGGCLPMVIQIPVFFALFRILGASIELRHAPFMLWINDLSAPDRLFQFPFQIPYMEPPSGIPVLTLLMGASMFVQQKMTPTPGDPSQAKIMLALPIVFTFLFINFPSGLVLYWLVNNVLSIGQQYRIKRSAA